VHAVRVFGHRRRRGATGRFGPWDGDDERSRGLWEERGVWAVCVERADKQREADREADGDDQCAAGRAEAEYSGGHSCKD